MEYNKHTIEMIAEITHEANKAYCECIGDYSQVHWRDAPLWQKESGIKGVEFNLENNASPSDTHKSWLEEKRKTGWIHGKIKNADLKEHPCCVEYDHLPEEQKMKDYIFSAIVNAFK